MKTFLRYLFFLIIYFVIPNYLYSQWTQFNGLYGGRFTALVANGTTYYAGSGAGSLFMTTNNGNSWTQIGSTLNFGNINSLLLDGSTLYVGCYNGVFQSTDNGISWNSINSGLSNNEVVSLVKCQNIFAATRSGGVFIFSDGYYWSPKNTGLPSTSNGNIVSIVANGTTLFAASVASGVFASIDNGNNWAPFKTGLTLKPGFNMNTLGVGKNYLYAGTSDGIYRSPLNTDSWTKITNQNNSSACLSFAFFDKYIYAGVQLGGVMISEDEGSTWKSFNSGMPTYFKDGQQFPEIMNSVFSLAINGNSLLAGTENGIYAITGLDPTWHSADVGLNAGSVTSLINGTQKIYAATTKGGIFYTSDNGNSWYNFNTGLRSTPNENLLASSGTNVYTIIGGQGPMILTTADMRWINTDPLNKSIWSILIYNSKIYLGTRDDGIWASGMDFKGFTKISNGLPSDQIQSLISVGNTLLAGTKFNGIYRSLDNGINWTHSNLTLTNPIINSFAVNNNEIYASGDNGTVLYSNDDGVNWTELVHTTPYNGLPPVGVVSLAVSNSTIFAAAGSDGVYRSNNKGGSWEKVNTGLTTKIIKILLINGNELWAGTDNSIWHRPISEMTSVDENKFNLPNEFVLYQNYPNPFNPATKINYSIPQTSLVKITIYNILGQVVADLVNEEKLAGNYTFTWNAKNVSSGIYICRITAVNSKSSFVKSIKMVYLK